MLSFLKEDAGELLFPVGAVPLVQLVLEEAGYKVEIENKVWECVAVAPQLFARLNGLEKHLVGLVARHARGVVLYNQFAEVVRAIELVSQLFP